MSSVGPRPSTGSKSKLRSITAWFDGVTVGSRPSTSVGRGEGEGGAEMSAVRSIVEEGDDGSVVSSASFVSRPFEQGIAPKIPAKTFELSLSEAHGMVVNAVGVISDVVEGSQADLARLRPGATIISMGVVNVLSLDGEYAASNVLSTGSNNYTYHSGVPS